jgi:hypothetical protein
VNVTLLGRVCAGRCFGDSHSDGARWIWESKRGVELELAREWILDGLGIASLLSSCCCSWKCHSSGSGEELRLRPALKIECKAIKE